MKLLRTVFALFATFGLCAVGACQDTIFTGTTSNDWDDPTNWDSGVLPGPADNLRIGDFNSGNTPVTAEITGDLTSPVVGDIRLGFGVLSEGTLNQSAGTLSTRTGDGVTTGGAWSFIGADGVNGAGATGTYNLSGTGAFVADIGVAGVVDTFDPNFGPGEFHLGIGSDGSGSPGDNLGTLALSDSASFTANRMYVGSNDGNTGVVNQSGGSLYVDDWLAVGRTGGATGTYNLSGGSLTVANDWLSIGESGAGEAALFARSSGMVAISGDAVVDVPTGGIAVGRFGARNDRPETPEVEAEQGGTDAEMSISGSNASISTAVLTVGYDGSNNGRFDGFFVKNDIDATLEFVADAGGVSPISVVGPRAGNPDDELGGASVWLNDGVDDPAFCADPVNPLDSCGMATLVVDLSAYASTADVKLIDVAPDGSVNGTFTGLAEGALVPGAGGRTITYMGGPDSNDVMLVGLQTGVDGDFDNNGFYECADVDGLVADIAAGNNTPSFDMNGDTVVDQLDLEAWLAEAGDVGGLTVSGDPVLPGDANLDGNVNGADFLEWNTNKFQDIAAWCAGDFNADGSVNGGDFLIWNTNKFTSADVAAVPEPASILILLGTLTLLGMNRRRS